MGRKKKISKYEVLEEIRRNNGDAIPVLTLADHFECTKPTVRARIRELQHEGISIIPTRLGVRLLEKIETEEQANEMLRTSNWLTQTVVSMSLIARISKPRMTETIKLLKSELDSEERQLLRNQLLLITRQIDVASVENAFE